MKTGINCWCFPADFNLEQSMKIAQKTGFDGIEINMEEKNKSEEISLNLNSTDKDIKKIKKKAENLKIEIPSISTSLFWNYSLTDSNKKIREKAINILKKMIDAADILDVDTILVVPGVVNENVSYREAYKRSLRVFQEVESYAEKKEVNIGIENVWNKFLLSPLEMNKFIEKIDSPYVGCYFDVGNVLNFSFPEYWIEILADKILKVHVKDFKTGIGNMSGFTHLLQGDVNWPRVIKALKEVDYNDYLTAELSPYQHFPENIADDTVNALNKIINIK
ncbi:MAG: sugar phosphate isomerase/epimerase family protein [Bacillota bacterium]